MSNPIDLLNAQRLAFLHAVYDSADGETDELVSTDELAAELGFTEKLMRKLENYLVDAGLLEHPVLAPAVTLTHYGRVEVEQARTSPDRPTDHLPSINVAGDYIQVGAMTNSQIQQRSPGASQSQTLDYEALRSFIGGLGAAIDGVGMPYVLREALGEKLEVVEVVLSEPKPNASLLRVCLQALQMALVPAAAAAAAPELVHAVDQLAAWIAALAA